MDLVEQLKRIEDKLDLLLERGESGSSITLSDRSGWYLLTVDNSTYLMEYKLGEIVTMVINHTRYISEQTWNIEGTDFQKDHYGIKLYMKSDPAASVWNLHYENATRLTKIDKTISDAIKKY